MALSLPMDQVEHIGSTSVEGLMAKLVDDNYLGRRIDSSVLLPELTRCLT